MGDGPRGNLPVGKLPANQLRSLLARIPSRQARLVVGPRIGEDAAVLEAGDRYLVVSTDPITFATERIGWYAVHVNANDVAVLGARPLWFSVVLLLPERAATPEMVGTIMADVQAACDELGVAVCGGHTEITHGIDRPIVVGQMIGEVAPARLVDKRRIRVGDQILLTRGVAIEGTAILARERAGRLRPHIDPGLLEKAAQLLVDPGISVVDAALTAAAAGDDVHAMHDPTEGGLVTGLAELVASSGYGLRVARERIRVLPETLAIAGALGLDPMHLLASGALLIAVAPAGVTKVMAALADRAIDVAAIGEVGPAAGGLTISEGDRVSRLGVKERDEIARVWES
jgi:hydrogenase expression/formation protein HypE